jgi:hypothetical protein
MIGEHALYRKIQIVIDIAKKGRTSSVADLSTEIFSKNLINFIYKYLDKETEEEVTRQSLPSINKAIKVCLEFGLISENGHLTSQGIKATDPDNFNAVLSAQIVKFLKSRNVTIQDIEKRINDMFHSSPPVLPTAKALWESLNPSIDFNFFSLTFTLLANCKKIVAVQNKVYVGFSK